LNTYSFLVNLVVRTSYNVTVSLADLVYVILVLGHIRMIVVEGS